MLRTLISRPLFRPLIFYWLPLTGWMALIFLLSGTTSTTLESMTSTADQTFKVPSMVIRAYLFHAVEFGIMLVLVYRLLARHKILTGYYRVGTALFATLVYAIVDEIHQSFVPGRDPSIEDIGYDATGALVAIVLIASAGRLRSRFSR